MLSFLYLAAMIYFGDRICRQFYRFISVPHRIATSFLVGLLLSTWITYLGSLAFAWTARPLIMGNTIFLTVFILAAYKLPRHPSSGYLDTFRQRPVGSNRWDGICIGAYALFACWLMFATLSFKDGNFQIAFKGWNDFGANLSLAQSLVLGHNFPTEHPFFPGEMIRYHFLFWFQAANLEFLGLNPVWSVNILSMLSLIALLILIMTFAEVLFNSRVVGRIAASLFFFSSSLSYIPFLRSQYSFRGAIDSILHSTGFLASGYPFRGETWGALTVGVFGNQRHLISGIGILFVVLTFLIDRYQYSKREANLAASLIEEGESSTKTEGGTSREIEGSESSTRIEGGGISPETEGGETRSEIEEGLTSAKIEEAESPTKVEAGGISPEIEKCETSTKIEEGGAPTKIEKRGTSAETVEDAQSADASPPETSSSSAKEGGTATKTVDNAQSSDVWPPETFQTDLKALIFSGALIGLLPYWNSAVFVSALVVFGGIFLFSPYRFYSALLIGAAVVIGLPQVLLLRSGSVAKQTIFYWGYTLDHPTLGLVLKYLGWTFGLKWILVFIALIFLSGFYRRLFAAFSVLLAVVFLFQLSPDVFNNHKLLNIWAILASIYAAYALWRIGKAAAAGTVLAIVLAVAMILGGVIDIFPIHNDGFLTVPYENDRLSKWLLDNTKPSDVFLTQTFLTHPILFTGRKIFLGYTLFAWTAGYNVGERDKAYRRMFEERDPVELVRLLNNNKIAYVAIDDGVRGNKTILKLNEGVYQQHFEKVFDDTDHVYDNLAIYKVPRP